MIVYNIIKLFIYKCKYYFLLSMLNFSTILFIYNLILNYIYYSRCHYIWKSQYIFYYLAQYIYLQVYWVLYILMILKMYLNLQMCALIYYIIVYLLFLFNHSSQQMFTHQKSQEILLSQFHRFVQAQQHRTQLLKNLVSTIE